MWVLSVDGKSAVNVMNGVTVVAKRGRRSDPNTWMVVALPPAAGIEVMVGDSFTEEQATQILLDIIRQTPYGLFKM